MTEAYGPQGDPSTHLPTEALEKGLAELGAAPAERGRIALLVARQPDGERVVLERAHLTAQTGMPGDRWERLLRDQPEAQLTVMRRDVAELIANGQPLTVFGDNLFVDLDISEANLPIGSRLRVGTAQVEVTPKPHTGCHKFRGRFGADALRWVNTRKDLNLRGIYFRVVEPGDVAAGDALEVLSRG